MDAARDPIPMLHRRINSLVLAHLKPSIFSDTPHSYAPSLERRRKHCRDMSSEAAGASQTVGPLESSIRQKLNEQLHPSVLEVVNDSHIHRHHAAMKSIGGGSGETHFSVNLVSKEFSGKPTIARHRLIYQILDQEFTRGIHALSLKTLTPEEYQRQTAASSN